MAKPLRRWLRPDAEEHITQPRDSQAYQLAGPSPLMDDVTLLSENELAALVADRFIFQSHHLLPQCNVLDHPHTYDCAWNRQRGRRSTQDYLNVLGLVNVLLIDQENSRKTSTAVVRALINKPKLLPADEAARHRTKLPPKNWRAACRIKRRRESNPYHLITSISLASCLKRTVRLAQGK